MVKRIDGYLHRQLCRATDIEMLKPNHFHYTCSRIAEWAFNVKCYQGLWFMFSETKQKAP
ncbi:hypothetical protein OTK49_26620 [Vibrio coralliirubri]|uniref:hypothetical protein n=1 Tax=Vibrio coralliirubri TaxID=1516159 RepID=UPI0022848775|nr:hypothetical protein [Vibrio coralliirubri]MCY9866115.1 hypothetical protein [Vibrio coralliirubri]